MVQSLKSCCVVAGGILLLVLLPFSQPAEATVSLQDIQIANEYQVLAYHSGILWISEVYSIVAYYDGEVNRFHLPDEFRTSNFLRSFGVAQDNTASIAHISPGFTIKRFLTEEGITQNIIVIREGSDGSIYAGSSGEHKLLKISDSGEGFRPVSMQTFQSETAYESLGLLVNDIALLENGDVLLATKSEQTKCEEVGKDGFITKPIGPDKFNKPLKKHIEPSLV